MLVTAGMAAMPASARGAEVDPQVYADLAAAPDGEATFILLMAGRADLAGAAQIADWDERGRYVVAALQGTAERAQARLLAAHRTAAIPGRISQFQPLWIVNAVVVRGDRGALDVLVQQPGVDRVLPDVKVAPLADSGLATEVAAATAKSACADSHLAGAGRPSPAGGERGGAGSPQFQLPGGLAAPEAPTACDPAANVWGVPRIGATAVWDAPYSVTGQGIVIGIVDTGVKWDHPALKGQYRGWNAAAGTVDHNYNWYNPAGLCDDTASGTCDADTDAYYPLGHGTHVTGIAAGWDGGTAHIGVAPGARWIHAVACTSNACPLAAIMLSLQWMLAPTDLTGANPDPAKRPHVVNNSWGSEGFGGTLIYNDALASLAAAGVMPVFAAGNTANLLGCGSLDSPGDNPPAFSVGSVTSADVVSSWSSRGPNPFTGATGPHVVAPGGGGICSAEATGSYGYGSGTSMAAPHVAGAAALLFSAEPSLIGRVAQVEEILLRTAVPLTTAETCGGVPGTQTPNNTYGWGRINVLAAIQMVWQAGVLSGGVTDAETGLPIAGATLSITRSGYTLTQATSASGQYRFMAGAGAYQVKAEAFGYAAVTVSGINVSQAAGTTQNFALSQPAAGSIFGAVSESGDPTTAVPDAVVDLLPSSAGVSTTTSANGMYDLADVPLGAQAVRVRAAGYATLTQNVDVTGAVTLDFDLAPSADYVVSDGADICSVEYNWIDATDGVSITASLGDDAAVGVTLPAPFTFYGSSYTTVYVASNGLLSFGQGYEYLNGVIPFVGKPNNAIYAFADDLNPAYGAQGAVYTKTLADGRFVIEFFQVQHSPGGNPETFEIVLNPADGAILLQYQAISKASNALVGLENVDGSLGIRYSTANSPAITPGLAVKFTLFSGQPVCGAATPLLEIGRDGGAVVLSWQHAEPNLRYEIWRADSPYFDPPQGILLDTISAVAGVMTYTAIDGIGDPLVNSFYLVRGIGRGGVFASSNRVGEFDFALTSPR